MYVVLYLDVLVVPLHSLEITPYTVDKREGRTVLLWGGGSWWRASVNTRERVGKMPVNEVVIRTVVVFWHIANHLAVELVIVELR